MTCKTCGHDESFHNRILNSDLCPFDYIDGECIGDGNRSVSVNQVKWAKMRTYTFDRMRRRYGYGTKMNQGRTNHDLGRYIDERGSQITRPVVCGCLKFVPAEEPCKK